MKVLVIPMRWKKYLYEANRNDFFQRGELNEDDRQFCIQKDRSRNVFKHVKAESLNVAVAEETTHATTFDGETFVAKLSQTGNTITIESAEEKVRVEPLTVPKKKQNLFQLIASLYWRFVDFLLGGKK